MEYWDWCNSSGGVAEKSDIKSQSEFGKESGHADSSLSDAIGLRCDVRQRYCLAVFQGASHVQRMSRVSTIVLATGTNL